jgi:formylglycine-generating enzyme required for sulfatase activity
VELGIQHEQQHQELILTDVKHLLSRNPLEPSFRGPWPLTSIDPGPRRWFAYPGGLQEFGHEGIGFAFDNEMPRHRAYVAPFELASDPVTNSEFAAFIDDGGYRRPELWLSLGWDTAQAQHWDAPLYWSRQGAFYTTFTLHGRVEVDPHAPVTHVASSRPTPSRAGQAPACRLNGVGGAARNVPIVGNFQESEAFHPLARRARARRQTSQLFGDVWEWTRSAYEPYPGYPRPQSRRRVQRKFMCNQYVLREVVRDTDVAHPPTYRNFFPPEARWQFTGIRLARS